MARAALLLLALAAAAAAADAPAGGPASPEAPAGVGIDEPVPGPPPGRGLDGEAFEEEPPAYPWHLWWILPLVQLAAVLHAIRTGRGWHWLWIILLFPGIGAAAYLLVEVLPARRRASGRLARERLLSALLPGREISRIEERLEVADTVENRRALARACVRAGRLGQATELYEGCLRGVFKDDPQTRLELAATHFLAGRDSECERAIEALRQSHPGHRPAERDLLHARVLDRLGARTQAFGLYEALAGNPKCVTEEARGRLAEMLEEDGDAERARGLYEDIVKRAKGFPRHHRRAEREWIARARSGLRRTRRTPRDARSHWRAP